MVLKKKIHLRECLMHASTSRLLKQNTSIIKGHFASFNIFFFSLFQTRKESANERQQERNDYCRQRTPQSHFFLLLSFCVSSALEPDVDSPSFSRLRAVVQWNEACKRTAFVRMITYSFLFPITILCVIRLFYWFLTLRFLILIHFLINRWY